MTISTLNAQKQFHNLTEDINYILTIIEIHIYHKISD